MVTIKIKRATRDQLNSAASAGNLVQGEPYLITDEDKLAVGLSTTTYQEYVADDDSRLSDARPIEWVSVPATKTSAGTVGQAARDDKHIYVVTATNVWGRGIIAKNWPA